LRDWPFLGDCTFSSPVKRGDAFDRLTATGTLLQVTLNVGSQAFCFISPEDIELKRMFIIMLHAYYDSFHISWRAELHLFQLT
jgi:hypothetical protein